MTTYYILYSLFALFQSATIGSYATFRGASQSYYKFLAYVSGIGALAFIVFSIYHFFVISFWCSIALIIGTLLIAPIIGLRLGRIPFVNIFAPVLAIVFGAIFFGYALYLRGVIQIVHV